MGSVYSVLTNEDIVQKPAFAGFCTPGLLYKPELIFCIGK
jgi:hypothetical protein